MDLSVTATPNNGSWGIHGRILPYLEEASLYHRVDLETAWDHQNAIDGLRIALIQCPSDSGAIKLRVNIGKSDLYPTSYGFNFGTWFIFDPATGRGGDGPFFPNSHLPLAKIKDGISKTMMVAEVKAWTPYMRNGGPAQTEIPHTAEEAATIVASAAQFKTTGHTEWPDGRVHHTGFTATMTPNTRVPLAHDGKLLDADFNSWQEGKQGSAGHPTYAIVTSRSYHPGGVEIVMLDGSVVFVADAVDLSVWRAAATRKGGETGNEFGDLR